MVIGKTYKEKHDIRQEKLRNLYGIKPWFAWFPVKENKGRWVWLRTIHRDCNILRINCNGNSVSRRYPVSKSDTYTTSTLGCTYYLENE